MSAAPRKEHRYRTHLATLILASLALPLLALFLTRQTSVLNFWDDWRWLFHDDSTSAGLLVVDIDEQSLADHGRWPWPRERLGELLHILLEKHRAAMVGVDIILADRDTDNAEASLPALDNRRIVWAHAASLGAEPPVSQGLVTPAPACPENAPWSDRVNGWLGLAPRLAGDHFRAGHIRPWPDGDQVVRTYMPFLSDGHRCVPALGLAMYGAVMGIPPDAPLTSRDGNWQWGGIPLGLESGGVLRMKWALDRIRSISAGDVLNGAASIPPGSVMLVGSTAVGIGDFVSVPGAERFAGVGVHGLALGQWLDRDFLTMPVFHDALAYPLLVAVFWLLWLASRQTTVRLWLAGLAAILLWHLLAFLVWRRDIYFETEPVLWALLWLPGIQGYRLWQEKRARNIIYNQFHAYLPERVLQELIDSEVDPGELAAQSREVTVLFADIQGFTTISENMEPVEAVSLLNEVMEYLSGHIADHDGTLDKFMGDSVMAFWGAPIEMPGHADNAIDCGVAMLAKLGDLNRTLTDRGLPPVSLGIGINSGRVAVGNMGSLNRKNYTVVGDVVNIASRLQNLCSTLDVNLLIGGDSADRSFRHNLCKMRDYQVKGKRKAVGIYCHPLFQPRNLASAEEKVRAH